MVTDVLLNFLSSEGDLLCGYWSGFVGRWN